MVNKKRLIDANALMDAFRKYMVDRHDKVKCASEENCKVCDRPCLWIRVVSDAPTVDAVEVVRCKDCKWYNRNEDIMPQSGSCEFHEMVKMDWDFCSRAKMDGDGNGM
jgi:hypothetical protein